jgi:hypothetical protein
MNGFFSCTGHVKGDATLTLCGEQNIIHLAQSNHLAVGAQQRIGGLRVVIRRFVWVEQTRSVDFMGLERVGLCEQGSEAIKVLNVVVVVRLACLWRIMTAVPVIARVTEASILVLSWGINSERED